MKLLPILIILLSCGPSFSQNKPSGKLKTTVKTKSAVKVMPVIFEAAYFRGTKVKQGELTFSFYTHDLGKITIESGKIIACDPINLSNGIAFKQTFPIGRFPVQLAMAKFSKEERVAYSRILFSDNAVAKWELALKPGQKPISLTDTIFYCYSVDASMAVFIDEAANKVFSPKANAEWESVFIAKTINSNYRGFIHKIDNSNFAAFMTGYGDGCYATYIGFDNQGNVCRLITDFGLVQWK